MKKINQLTPEQSEELYATLRARFKKHKSRHPRLEWAVIQTKLEANPKKLLSIYLMEETGGEPDVVGFDEKTKEYIFYDCTVESPKARRSVCYDNEALESRTKHKPANSALGMATEMGIALLTEEQYQELQKLGEFDLKTSSWLATPSSFRSLGGAIFGDRRFGRVFIYHNGAESYYGARGFRGSLQV